MPSPTETSDKSAARGVQLREPTLADGAAVWSLRKHTGVLDENSPYAYLLVCDRFAKSSVVAVSEDRVVGFVCGLRTAEQPDTLFVWQVAVDPSMQGAGLGRRMLEDIARRNPAARWLEATVTPTNESSRALFRSFARSRNCRCEERPCYRAEHFPGSGHEPEDLFRIGPLNPAA